MSNNNNNIEQFESLPSMKENMSTSDEEKRENNNDETDNGASRNTIPTNATATTTDDSRKKLKIDTNLLLNDGSGINNANSIDIKTVKDTTKNTGGGGSATPTTGTTKASTASSSAQDIHPYARGAVIEVWHIQRIVNENKNNDDDDDDDWWSSSSSDNDDDDNKERTRKRTVRLCDVIDRAPIAVSASTSLFMNNGYTNRPSIASNLAFDSGIGSSSNINATTPRTPSQPPPLEQQQQWRYYVHYRDFNRRMDEWITMDRIASPPSIGNAKARQLKKEEDREKKRQERILKQQQYQQNQQKQSLLSSAATSLQRQQQQQQVLQQPLDGGDNKVSSLTPPGGNTRRRRSTVLTLLTEEADLREQINSNPIVVTSTTSNNSNNSTTNSTTVEGGRRRRLSRRKAQSFMDLPDDATVTASNVGGGNDSNHPSIVRSQSMDPFVVMHDASERSTEFKKSASTTTDKKDMIINGGNNTSNNKSHGANINKMLVSTQTVGEHIVGTVQAVELDEHEGLDEASLREHEEVTKIKNVGMIELGRHRMETWYFSPIPKELMQSSIYGTTTTTTNTTGNNNNNIPTNNNATNNTPGTALINNSNTGGNTNVTTTTTNYLEVLYICEFTLRLFARKVELQRYQQILPVSNRHPPGNEIYRYNNIAMFEVDGYEERIYCQNLCYIAKLFLDHKTLYFDVDPFLFYILCEVDEYGYHMVGYFSKEKYSDVGYNLACILAFPAHQRKGYGRFLISFSYELSKKEDKVGSPEKPMSDLGQQAYKPYWASTIIDFLLYTNHLSKSLSIMDISKQTSIMVDDIIFTLNQLGLLKIINDGVYFIVAEKTILLKLAKKYPIKEPKVIASEIHWTPYIMNGIDAKRDKYSIHNKRSNIDQ